MDGDQFKQSRINILQFRENSQGFGGAHVAAGMSFLLSRQEPEQTRFSKCKELVVCVRWRQEAASRALV